MHGPFRSHGSLEVTRRGIAPLQALWLIRCVAIAGVVFACSGRDGGSTTDPDAAFEQWTLGAPTVRIGGSESHGGAQLSAVKQVVPYGDDSVFVTDAEITSVLAFDGHGTLVRQIGRPGQGPGEFGFITAIGLVGDTLWVTDLRRRLIHFFTRDGAVRRATPMVRRTVRLRDGGTITVVPRAVIPGGMTVGFVPVTDSLPPGAPPAPPHGTVGILGYFDSLGVARDTLRWLADGGTLLVMFIGDNIYFPGPHHFDGKALWTVAGDGSSVAVADRPVADDSTSARYRITKWDDRGEQVFSTQIRYTPLPVPPALVIPWSRTTPPIWRRSIRRFRPRQSSAIHCVSLGFFLR